TLNLLHVEDDQAQRMLVAHHLRAVEGYTFSVVHAATEEEAVAIFRRGGIDLVILDYHLQTGDGLGCLRQLRCLDPLVPVIVVSAPPRNRQPSGRSTRRTRASTACFVGTSK